MTPMPGLRRPIRSTRMRHGPAVQSARDGGEARLGTFALDPVGPSRVRGFHACESVDRPGAGAGEKRICAWGSGLSAVASPRTSENSVSCRTSVGEWAGVDGATRVLRKSARGDVANGYHGDGADERERLRDCDRHIDSDRLFGADRQGTAECPVGATPRAHGLNIRN